MVDVQNYTETLTINKFHSLNLRDNEDYLPLGDSVRAKNFDINTPLSLKKKLGITSLYGDETFHSAGIALRNADYYTDRREVPYYLAVSYPNIYQITPPSGYARAIYSGLNGMGEGQFIKGGVGESMWVDGTNKPTLISDGIATQVTWPPVYTNQNASILSQSQNAVATNPTTLGTDIWYPSLGVYFEGRWYLAGDPLAPQRLYASKIRSSDFSDNTAANRINVAFFVDILTNSPIIGLKVINNKYLIIFCRNEIHVLTGKYPPTIIAPEPKINITILNPDVGLLGKYAFCDKGNNDIFFMSNRQSLYTLSATNDFQDVRPHGLSSQIYPAFEAISVEQMSRSRLINNNIKGELELWFPSTNRKYYPDKRFIYHYEEQEVPAWGEDDGFKLSLRGAFIDRSQNLLILVDRDKLLQDNLGVTYDGELIDTQFEIAPLDFGDRDDLKEVVKVEIAYKIPLGGSANLIMEHLWDNGQKTGLKSIRLISSPSDVYDGDGVVYGTAVYGSDAGNPINTATFEMLNPEGRVLKIFLRCQSSVDLTVVDVKLRFKRKGKDVV